MGAQEIPFLILSYSYRTFFDQTNLSSSHIKMSFDLNNLHYSSTTPFLSWMETPMEQEQWSDPAFFTRYMNTNIMQNSPGTERQPQKWDLFKINNKERDILGDLQFKKQ